MTRKDSEKDTERPHYYSQFWLDVAAGRREISTPRPEEGTEPVEAETPEAAPLHQAGRGSTAPVTDGHKVTRGQTMVEPEYPPEEFVEPEEEIGLASVVDDMDLPNILVDDTLEDTTFPDQDHILEEEEPETEEEEEMFYDEDEDEEEDSWSARGRKKPKPGRQIKQPKKKPRREPHRGF